MGRPTPGDISEYKYINIIRREAGLDRSRETVSCWLRVLLGAGPKGVEQIAGLSPWEIRYDRYPVCSLCFSITSGLYPPPKKSRVKHLKLKELVVPAW